MRNALSRDEATTPAPLEDKLKQCSKSKTYAIRRSKKIYLSSYRIEIVPNFFSKFKPSSSTLPSFPFALLFCANKFVANGCRVWHTAYSVHLFAFVCGVLSSFIRFLRMYRLKYLWRCQCLPSAKRTSGHVRADIVGQPTTDNSFRFSQRIPEIRVKHACTQQRPKLNCNLRRYVCTSCATYHILFHSRSTERFKQNFRSI